MMNNSYLLLLRPKQWLKNLILLFPPFLGGQLNSIEILQNGILPISAFCMASSSTYVLNDMMDRHIDALHPQKCNRPISLGKITLKSAYIMSLMLLLSSLVLALYISLDFGKLVFLYLAVSILYSLRFKTVPVLDIFCISAGFLLRLQAGGAAFSVHISPWLFLSVFLLSVFLSAGKRLGEYKELGEYAAVHRKSLSHYPNGFLSSVMNVSGSAVIITYAMYSLSKPMLLYTVPLCLFGLLRYLLRVQNGQNGDPTESLIKDKVLLFVSLIWVLMVAWSIYF